MSLSGRRVLYISYNGMLEPLGQSQVIPYLRELSRLGVEFTLLSFERANAFTGEGIKRTADLKRELAQHGIDWRWLRYHKSPSIPATAFDVNQGFREGKKIVRQKRIELVHARSHIPAIIASRLKRRFNVRMIFDLRGLMADEYVDAAHWNQHGLRYRLTKLMEKNLFANADAVVTLTERIWPVIRDWEGLRGRDVVHQIVPCCVDLSRFTFNAQTRRAKRIELGISEHQNVLVYSGSIGGWYLTDEMAEFFSHLRQINDDWHFLWLTQGSAELIRKTMNKHGITTDRYSVVNASPADVPAYLSSADAAVAFYKPALSRLATSPVKVAEYLACGLPIVLNTGVGDSEELITCEGVGALVHDFNEAEYSAAAKSIASFIAEREATRKRSRAVAERLFDVGNVGLTRYAKVYEELLENAT
jgi:glycosyltransferase involved in cell wall biosynthesis